MKKQKKNAAEAKRLQQEAQYAQEKAKAEHAVVVEERAQAKAKLEEAAEIIDKSFGLVSVTQALLDSNYVATIVLDGADEGFLYPLGATRPFKNESEQAGIIKALVDKTALPCHCQLVCGDRYLDVGLYFRAPNEPVDIIVDAQRFSRHLRLEFEHLATIKCFSARCLWSEEESRWTRLVKLTVLNNNSVELLLSFGRRFRLELPVNKLDLNQCKLLDSSCFRLGFDRLLHSMSQKNVQSIETTLVSVAPPISTISNDQNFATTSIQHVLNSACTVCGQRLGLSVQVDPLRAPSDESELYLEPGRPVECLRALRLSHKENSALGVFAGPRPIFPPSFLIELSRGRKARPALCARCQADLGLIFFEQSQPADLVLYKHRLLNAADQASVAFVASLIADAVNNRGLRNVRLLAPESFSLGIRVFRIDGHAISPALHVDTEERSVIKAQLIPTISLAFSDNPKPDELSADADIDLFPDDFLMFRAHLDKLRLTAPSRNNVFAAVLGSNWHLVSISLPISTADCQDK